MLPKLPLCLLVASFGIETLAQPLPPNFLKTHGIVNSVRYPHIVCTQSWHGGLCPQNKPGYNDHVTLPKVVPASPPKTANQKPVFKRGWFGHPDNPRARKGPSKQRPDPICLLTGLQNPKCPEYEGRYGRGGHRYSSRSVNPNAPPVNGPKRSSVPGQPISIPLRPAPNKAQPSTQTSEGNWGGIYAKPYDSHSKVSPTQGATTRTSPVSPLSPQKDVPTITVTDENGREVGDRGRGRWTD